MKNKNRKNLLIFFFLFRAFSDPLEGGTTRKNARCIRWSASGQRDGTHITSKFRLGHFLADRKLPIRLRRTKRRKLAQVEIWAFLDRPLGGRSKGRSLFPVHGWLLRCIRRYSGAPREGTPLPPCFDLGHFLADRNLHSALSKEKQEKTTQHLEMRSFQG